MRFVAALLPLLLLALTQTAPARAAAAAAAGADAQAEAMAARAFAHVEELQETRLPAAEDKRASVRRLASALLPFVLRRDSPCRHWPDTLRCGMDTERAEE